MVNRICPNCNKSTVHSGECYLCGFKATPKIHAKKEHVKEDVFEDCLSKKGFTLFNPNIGISTLKMYVGRWAGTANSVKGTYKDFIDEYLNDLNYREGIHECLHVVPIEQIGEIDKLLTNSDKKFLENTDLLDHCIWGKITEIINDYNPKTHWWYYRIPKKRSKKWNASGIWDGIKRSNEEFENRIKNLIAELGVSREEAINKIKYKYISEVSHYKI
jgi:hypothetical protein